MKAACASSSVRDRQVRNQWRPRSTTQSARLGRHDVQIDARRVAGIRLTQQALDGRRPRIGEAAVDDGEQVDVAAAGAESAGGQGTVQDHRPGRGAGDVGDGAGERPGGGHGGRFVGSGHPRQVTGPGLEK
ncbi:hypothetical protein ACFQFC_08100 [Amorphoplanes digitatis]|uniref:Uncharacterized protein n=1 Tax=Actinoplanes digitatis TaxID=1868 RepID=A0A7W7MS11_9ACTN|nr:hypothetical protein [Actinoplanes digitatis]MBB4764165.1 hypothetical protein [Actinoplanes digitatis]GID97554.1 hypothetical protein Adi01nite_69660 [Actinoplanes digitatis]